MTVGLSWTSIIILLCSVLLVPYAMGLFNFGKNCFQVEGRVNLLLPMPLSWTYLAQTVLLTGGSEGMGLSVAKILAQKGASIIIVARDVAKLESALQQIKVLSNSI